MVLANNSSKIDGATLETLKHSNQKTTEQKQEDKLRDACESFESFFTNMIFKNMRKATEDLSAAGEGEENMFKKGTGESMFQDMLDEQYSDDASHQGGGLGLGKMVFDSLKDLLPTNQHSATNAKSVEATAVNTLPIGNSDEVRLALEKNKISTINLMQSTKSVSGASGSSF